MRNFFCAFFLFFAASRLLAAQTPPATGRTLEFVPNQGQWPATIRYAAAVPGGHLLLEPAGLRYVLLEPLAHPHPGPSSRPAADSLVRGHQLRVHFEGANAAAPLAPATATGEVRSYLLGSDPAAWAAQVPGYRQVRYQQPWPGVAARFYENERHLLEYDFELAAGADPAQVRLRYEGASTLRLDEAGNLRVGTSVSTLTELAPRAYQPDAATGQRRPVACHYRLDAEARTVSFELGGYDHQRPLVIDPTVQFSTYTGAITDNWGFAATYDAVGNLYSGGITLSLSAAAYPTTMGAFQTTFGGLVDIALIKYNTRANGAAARVWATYLGGSAHDFPSSLLVNAQNELLVLGTTASANYPTTGGAVQRTFGGGTNAQPFGSSTAALYAVARGTDLVISRLSADGSHLLASTYLGGTGNDGLVPYDPRSVIRQLPQNYGDPFRSDLATDADGNVYVASVTSSSNFPTTAGSFGPSYRGGTSDAVVVKLTPSLGSLVWSGLLGGGAADAAYSLQLDANRNVYVAGGTMSSNFPATAGAYQTSAAGNVDGFVACVAAGGNRVQQASYLGTSAYDQAYAVQLGADGGVYLLGQTLGNWPVSAGAYSNPGSRQFIQKMSAELDKRLLSTVFGSGRPTIDISPTAFLVDQCDRVYVCGWGGTINQISSFAASNGYTHGLPTTAGAVRTTPDTPGAGSDFYLAQFAAGLGSLRYATYYGNPDPGSEGDHVDGGTSRFDPRGAAYSAVCSCGNVSSFPVPPGAYSYSTTNNSSNCNNAAFRLDFELNAVAVAASQTVCATGSPVPLVGYPAGGTWSGPGVSGSVGAGFVFTPTPALAGVQVLSYSVPNLTPACPAAAQLRLTVLPEPVLVPTLVPNPCPSSPATPYTVHYQFGSGALAADAGVTWYFGDDSTAVTGLDVTHTYQQPGTYHPRLVVSYNSGRCSSQATLAAVEVLPMQMPNLILPASPTLNNAFRPRVGGCPPHLRIYSRWGRLVHEDPAYQGTWDATGLAAGLYYYLLTPTDGAAAVKGWVEVVK